MRTLAILLFLSIALVSRGATYTICASGCDYTTFSALFSAVDLAPGDIVEARAATPGGSVSFAEEVEPGANDFGSSGSPLTIRARAGDDVTITGSNTRAHSMKILDAANDYITVSGFTFTGYTNYGLRVWGDSGNDIVGFTVTNCTFMTVSNHIGNVDYPSLMGFFPRYTTSLLVTSNRFRTEARAIQLQTDAMQCAENTDCIIEFNDFDMRNDDGGGHNDCTQFNTSGRKSVGTQIIRWNRMANNSLSTNYTQLVFHEYATNGTVLIYGNVFVVSNANTGSFALTVTPKEPSALVVVITNNTLWVNGNNPGYRVDEHIQNPVFKRNIFYNKSGDYDSTGFWIESTNVTPSLIDENIYFTHSASVGNFLRDKTAFRTWSAWQGAGYDVSGYFAEPGFVNTNGTDLSITSSSLAYNGGNEIGAYNVLQTPPTPNVSRVHGGISGLRGF